MKTKIVSLYGLVGGAACAGAVLLTTYNTSAQNLLVSTYTGGNIYQIALNGTVSTFASGLSYPIGMTYDSSGNLFVANSANNAPGFGYIGKIALNGTQSIFASGLDPQAVAFNSGGNLFEADYRSGNIYQFTPGGVQSTFASGLTDPISMAFDAAGNLFVGAGYGNNNGYIMKIAPNGAQSLFASGLSFPEGLTFDSAGNLYEANGNTDQIFKFTPGGTQSLFASVNDPNFMVFDNAGDMYVATVPGPIIKIAPGGAQSTLATLAGTPADIIWEVPEPSVIAFVGSAGLALLVRRQVRRVLAERVCRMEN